MVTGCSGHRKKAPKEPWGGVVMINNLDTIIEKSFRDCGIEDYSLIDEAKSNLKITISDSK